ncbi:MAG: hypothetical protein NTW29_00625 [Bacteroidetes bacterium]|nr:hypothetical protein [Bacteroidota bacterium]
MKKLILHLLFILVCACSAIAQPEKNPKLKVFISCNNSWCDMQYIRTEITIVDFLLDNIAADVHVLITSQGTGSGGDQYQLIFFGQQQFKNQTDTLRFNTDPNITDFEERDLLLKYIKAGLVPYIIKTGAIDQLQLQLKSKDSTGVSSLPESSTKDPWNYWVMRMSSDGYLNGDANYQNTRLGASASANRITNELKTGMGVEWNKNKSVFDYEVNGATEKFTVKNHNFSLNHFLVKSISNHWSWAYELKYMQNTFFNNKGRVFGKLAVEYDVFPYKDVNNKLLTFSYGVTARNNRYYDTTIYNKIKETVFTQRADIYLSLNQKWGVTSAGFTFQHYLHDSKLYNLGVDLYSSVRITGGLSFYFAFFGGLTRNQIFLQKGNATPEEVLARRRQLSSGYYYFSNFGITYRFGSKLNNFVNPRFDRSGYLSEE